jgi:2-dehydropantoate 2-reductase
LLIDAFNETAAVARAMGVGIDDDFVNETIGRLDKSPSSVTPSMQKDMMAGRPSELNEQTGAVIRMGKAAGVPTPTHEKLLAALLPFEQKARGQ